MNRFKRSLQRASPGVYNLLASIRFFLKCRSALGPSQALIAKVVFQNGPIHVKGGPFEGMAYYNKTIWGTITSKWLGCYELEIQPVIEEIIDANYQVIVDVGAAEGYYAVGLALKMPRSKVISYDIDPIARFRQAQLARLNKVTNLVIRKYCSPEELAELTPGETLVICDIEGFEYLLMDPDACPALQQVDLLVETHRYEEMEVADVAAEIGHRFAGTHEIQRFFQAQRDREGMRQRVPELKALSDEETDFALDEGRYQGQVWLWMKAKGNR